jgi:hypothetical protein
VTRAVLTIASFRPELFNVIGDQGNLDVLCAEARWAGVECARVELSPANAATADFVLLGAASLSAMRALEPELAQLEPHLIDRAAAERPSLYLGSCFIRFAPAVFGLQPAATQRVSDYYRGDYNGNSVVGYLNSDSTLPPLTTVNGQIGSLLSGPLLAKNRWLLEAYAGRLGFELATPEEVLELQRLASC